MSDEQLLATLNSMQASLKADLSSVKVELLEHIHGVGAQLLTQIKEVVVRLDRIGAKLDRQCDLLEGALRGSNRIIEWAGSKNGK